MCFVPENHTQREETDHHVSDTTGISTDCSTGVSARLVLVVPRVPVNIHLRVQLLLGTKSQFCEQSLHRAAGGRRYSDGVGYSRNGDRSRARAALP
jgi:hypothetical protein